MRADRCRERGAVMVETAIVVPVMLLIFAGLTQLAFAMSTSSAATGASRTGARLAASVYAEAALSGDATQLNNTLDAIRLGVERDLSGRPSGATPTTLWLFRADANGNPASGPSCSSDCVRWTWNGTQFASRSGTWTTPDSCGSVVDTVGVRVSLTYDVASPFLGDISIRRATTMRLEPVTNLAC